ncbi:Acid phosphatase/vanadium-dependent haloperoxidase-related protein [Citrus sinensis]|uniref:Acid phosphatase/vanadium-dependent haloperoxidase-related protein n=1 Tax=Citrus sinensis TaxID=2711 RepID=A0ACB8MPX6_CITSI|nr:Acid phosphatase/vanadium-dependent haloperoxidase-related protein [Citrus sinensis]
MDALTIKPTSNSLRFGKTKPLPPTRLSFFKFTHFNKLRASSVIAFCVKGTPSNPQNRQPEYNNNNDTDNHNHKRNFPVNPFCVLFPILQSIKGLASSQTKKWASRLQAHSSQLENINVIDQNSNDYLQTGAFGAALLSVTSTAKVKISPFVATLAANPTFVSGLFAWMIAQSTKVFLNFFVERKWDLRLLFASGGMPSSHSALCTALTTSVALCHGVADSLFPVCLGFSLIVMYDAIGVRRHAGMQAEVLNMIVEDLFQGHPISQRKLKELLGHTPSQVFAGAMLAEVKSFHSLSIQMEKRRDTEKTLCISRRGQLRCFLHQDP